MSADRPRNLNKPTAKGGASSDRPPSADATDARGDPSSPPIIADVNDRGTWSLAFVVKRQIDLVGAFLGLILLAPVILIIALLIRLDSPGPIIFRQLRRGYRGRLFRVLKFRTMTVDAEQRLPALESSNESDGGVLFKLREDPRVTKLGRFLRRSHLDELPQLMNVVWGEMSLVGPRPLQLRDSDKLLAYDPELYRRRLEVLPGLTGLWQVSRRSELEDLRMFQVDVEYANNWSLLGDLRLLTMTLMILLFQPTRLAGDSLNPSVHVASQVSHNDESGAPPLSETGISRRILREQMRGWIKYGATAYPLKLPVSLTYKELSNLGWEVCADSFGSDIVGRGETKEDAGFDWCEQVHIAFQKLYRKVDFEMTPQEQSQWANFENLIDVPAYLALRPLVMRQIGQVCRVRPSPSLIVWSDQTHEEVPLVALPDEFARLEPGQWFETITERDRSTKKLRHMRYLHPIAKIEPLTAKRVEAFWAALPTTATLPASTRDLTN
jgi:lipopolysaccharide/colanic/teichoic acid biosynthesis glycosyltransferase